MIPKNIENLPKNLRDKLKTEFHEAEIVIDLVKAMQAHRRAYEQLELALKTASPEYYHVVHPPKGYILVLKSGKTDSIY